MISDDQARPTVLLLEQDEGFRRSLEEFLGSKGLTVRTVWNTKQAAGLLQDPGYDILLASNWMENKTLSSAIRQAITAKGTRAILLVNSPAEEIKDFRKFGPLAYFLRTTERSILDELSDILILAMNPIVLPSEISDMMGIGPDSREEIDFESMQPEVRLKLERLVLIRRKGKAYYGGGNAELNRTSGNEGIGGEGAS